MSGRVMTGILSDIADWRVAMGTIGLLALASALVFWASLPPSRHFRRRSLAPRALFGTFAAHLAAPALPSLFALAFLLMGGFVATYNYIGYRLTGAPYGLSQTIVGFIFLSYLAGTASSAWMGGLAGRLGRHRVLPAGIVVMLAGIGLTAIPWLPAIVAGMAVLTFGFFGAHSVASGWVGGAAKQAKAQASSLYLFSYYLGSSVVGAVAGLAWSGLGWPGVAGLVGMLAAVALAIALRLARRPAVI
jgi:YNFM family putative membrane transporter